MRFGTSSPLAHESARDWAEQQVALGCKTVVFPVQSDAPIGKIDSEMPIIVEHLDTDEEYKKYLKVVQRVAESMNLQW